MMVLKDVALSGWGELIDGEASLSLLASESTAYPA